MAIYRIQGQLGGDQAIAIDQIIIADSDELAIAMAKGIPIPTGMGLANWGRLTDSNDTVLWETGDRA